MAAFSDLEDLSLDEIDPDFQAQMVSRGDQICSEDIECEIIVEDLTKLLLTEAKKAMGQEHKDEVSTNLDEGPTDVAESDSCRESKVQEESVENTAEAMLKQIILGAVLVARDIHSHLLNVPAKADTQQLLILVRSMYASTHDVTELATATSHGDTSVAPQRVDEAVASGSKGDISVVDVEAITRWIADTLFTSALAQMLSVPGATPILEALREEELRVELKEIITDIVRYPVGRSLSMALNVKSPTITTPWYQYLVAGIWTGLPEGACKQSDTAKLEGLFNGIFSGLLETDMFQAQVSLCKALQVVYSTAKESMDLANIHQFTEQEASLAVVIENLQSQVISGPYEVNFSWFFCLAIGLMSQDALWCERHCPFISVVNDVLNEDKRGAFVAVNGSGNLVLQSKSKIAGLGRILRLVCGCSKDNIEKI